MDVEVVSNSFSNHFQQVKATPAAEWLQEDVGSNSIECPSYCTIDTTENIKAWLLRPMENLSLASSGENCVDEEISLSRDSEVEKNLENNDSQEMATEKKVSDDWLIGSFTSHPPQPFETESWLQRFRESTAKSSSDWLIASKSEALPAYCEWLTEESSERCKSCPGECAKDTFNAFRNVFNGSRSEWLATASDW